MSGGLVDLRVELGLLFELSLYLLLSLHPPHLGLLDRIYCGVFYHLDRPGVDLRLVAVLVLLFELLLDRTPQVLILLLLELHLILHELIQSPHSRVYRALTSQVSWNLGGQGHLGELLCGHFLLQFLDLLRSGYLLQLLEVVLVEPVSSGLGVAIHIVSVRSLPELLVLILNESQKLITYEFPLLLEGLAVAEHLVNLLVRPVPCCSEGLDSVVILHVING